MCGIDTANALLPFTTCPNHTFCTHLLGLLSSVPLSVPLVSTIISLIRDIGLVRCTNKTCFSPIFVLSSSSSSPSFHLPLPLSFLFSLSTSTSSTHNNTSRSANMRVGSIIAALAAFAGWILSSAIPAQSELVAVDANTKGCDPSELAKW